MQWNAQKSSEAADGRTNLPRSSRPVRGFVSTHAHTPANNRVQNIRRGWASHGWLGECVMQMAKWAEHAPSRGVLSGSRTCRVQQLVVSGDFWGQMRVLTPTWLEPGCQLPARGPGSTRQLLSPTVRVPREKIGFHPSIHLLHVSAIMHTVAQHEKYPKVSPCCVMHHRRHSPQPNPGGSTEPRVVGSDVKPLVQRELLNPTRLFMAWKLYCRHCRPPKVKLCRVRPGRHSRAPPDNGLMNSGFPRGQHLAELPSHPLMRTTLAEPS
jgi:hypothetical protein